MCVPLFVCCTNCISKAQGFLVPVLRAGCTLGTKFVASDAKKKLRTDLIANHDTLRSRAVIVLIGAGLHKESILEMSVF